MEEALGVVVMRGGMRGGVGDESCCSTPGEGFLSWCGGESVVVRGIGSSRVVLTRGGSARRGEVKSSRTREEEANEDA